MLCAFGMARLGRDAELRYTPHGDAVCNLSLAFNYGKKDESTGQRPTTWVDATLWGRRAEALAPYLLKGMALTVTLEEVHIEYYKNRDGAETPKLAARVVDIDLGASPMERTAPEPQRRAAPMPVAARVAPAPRGPARAPAPGGSGFDDMESDDIPF
jgi:single-strand DNA-binding protein